MLEKYPEILSYLLAHLRSIYCLFSNSSNVCCFAKASANFRSPHQPWSKQNKCTINGLLGSSSVTHSISTLSNFLVFTETGTKPQCPWHTEIRSITTEKRAKQLLDLTDYWRQPIKSMYCTNSATLGDKGICKIQVKICFLKKTQLGNGGIYSFFFRSISLKKGR